MECVFRRSQFQVLNLTSLEERLVAPRICFLQLRELPRGRQLKICGAVVNVPANLNFTVSSLPRVFDDSYTVAVKLKRRLIINIIISLKL